MGPRDVSLISKAIAAMAGADKTMPVAATATFKARRTASDGSRRSAERYRGFASAIRTLVMIGIVTSTPAALCRRRASGADEGASFKSGRWGARRVSHVTWRHGGCGARATKTRGRTSDGASLRGHPSRSMSWSGVSMALAKRRSGISGMFYL